MPQITEIKITRKQSLQSISIQNKKLLDGLIIIIKCEEKKKINIFISKSIAI